MDVWFPKMKEQGTDPPQLNVCKEEEDLADIQERNSGMDPEDADPPQIKREQEDLLTNQDGEQLLLKEESDTFRSTPTYMGNAHSEGQTWNSDETLKKDTSVIRFVIGASKSDLHPLYNDADQLSAAAEDAEPKQDNQQHRSKALTDEEYHLALFKTHCTTHAAEKSYTCDVCGKDFKCKSNFQRHLRMHTGEKPYSCGFCGNSYSRRSSLNIHLRNHTGEKPDLCKICGKRFFDMPALKRHLRIHTGEKPYLCKICGKDFRQSGALTVHMRIHTGEMPYSCETCGRGFKRSGELTVHIRIAHTGEKPYLCTTCGRGFSDSSSLSVHTRIHTGEKPYVCEMCGTAFRHSSHMTIHMRTHGGGKSDFLQDMQNSNGCDATGDQPNNQPEDLPNDQPNIV